MKNDLRLSFLVIFLSVLLLGGQEVYTRITGGRQAERLTVVVSRDGEEILSLPLEQKSEYVEVLENGSGGSNTLHIGGGAVWVTDASCPDRICEKTGRISEAGAVIVCMPNRLIVQLVQN